MYEELQPMQQVEYDILRELDRVCREHNLQYFLAYGTLLGAVRHGGFIPWDDDIDVVMAYEDYNKLEQLHCFQEPYFLQSYESEPECGLCCKKLRRSDTTLLAGSLANKPINHGINIDIYPIYHLADKRFDRMRQYVDAVFYMLLTVGQPPENHGSLYAAAAKLILSLFSNERREKFRQKVFQKMIRFESVPTKRLFSVMGSIEEIKKSYKSEWFSHTVNMKFEDGTYFAPIGYKEFLAASYGDDYMTLPPKEEQGIKLQDIIAWDASVPYQVYEEKMKSGK